MKSVKVKICLIIALLTAFVATLAAFVGVNVFAARTVTVSGSNIFNTAGDAEVWAHRETGAGDTVTGYAMFVLKNDDDAVNYRKDLAYKWFANSALKENKEDLENPVNNGASFFEMEVGFEILQGEKLDFDKFIITFESQQFSQTKDEKTVNYLYFTPAADNKVNVHVACKQPDDENAEEAFSHAAKLSGDFNYDHIKISFTDKTDGAYTVGVTDGIVTGNGKFENVGGYFAKYSSSSTTPVTPLSFKAKFAEDEKEHGYAKLALYSLNGQNFAYNAVNESGEHYTGTTVNDETPAVLCLEKELTFIEEGKEIDFDYRIIDVLASAPSRTVSYFMLTKQQAEAADFNAENCSDDSPYRVIKDDDDQLMIPHVGHFMPAAGNYNQSETVFGDDCTPVAAVKVYLKLTDTTATDGVSTAVLLDWYIEDAYKLTVKNHKYIAVAKDDVGATYAYTDVSTKTSAVTDVGWKNKITEYQKKVDEAAKDLKAGNKNYFYLPAVTDLLSDNITKNSDLTYSIYYNNGSQQSNTGRKADNLSINLSKAGRYIFTVYVTDAAGNNMYYFKDGKPEEIKSSDIWTMRDDDTERDLLPWFTFSVGSSEISIEDPGEQNTAYVGSEYTSISFDINGVSYDTQYNLYLFRNDLYSKENGVTLTYDEFMEKKADLFVNHRNWFKRIAPLDDMNEEDEEYKEYKDYAWNSSSPSFVPQDENAFYLVVCTATSNENGAQQATAYMGISAAPKVRPIQGENTWLKDNLTSVILLSIAGVSLVGIVLLLVIKPKNKGDIDEEFEAVRKSGKKNKKK